MYEQLNDLVEWQINNPVDFIIWTNLLNNNAAEWLTGTYSRCIS